MYINSTHSWLELWVLNFGGQGSKHCRSFIKKASERWWSRRATHFLKHEVGYVLLCSPGSDMNDSIHQGSFRIEGTRMWKSKCESGGARWWRVVRCTLNTKYSGTFVFESLSLGRSAVYFPANAAILELNSPSWLMMMREISEQISIATEVVYAHPDVISIHCLFPSWWTCP